MKFFCNECKKAFDFDNAVDGQVICPDCNRRFDLPESDKLTPGVVIGDFLIEGSISSGGMGQVFLARQLSLDRNVALKVLHRKYTNDKEYVDSLYSEARAAAKINHPNIVQAYAVGEDNGIFYFAMEYIRGKTFKEILKEQGKLSFEQAAKVICEIAGALNVAWREQKLVHQDIKPDNIMLDANGFAKLADLGLAKTGASQQSEEESDEVLGTPQYISPEQLTGVPTDVRSDIYSLGATFYHFVTGRFPYEAALAEDIAKMHVAGKLTPPKEINPELPDELNTIILKMMARYPEERYQTPEPLIMALELYQRSVEKHTSTLPKIKLGGKKVTPVAATATAKPVLSTQKAPAARPTVPTAKPAAPAARPTVPTAKPAAPAARPTVPTAKPVTPAARPAVPTGKPVTPAAKPVAKPAIPVNPDKKATETQPTTENAPTTTPEPKKGKTKKIIKWSFIGIGILLLLVIAALTTIYILERKGKTPAFLKPIASRLQTSVKSAMTDAKEKALELSKPTMTYTQLDTSAPDVTDASLQEINDILNWRISNPADEHGFLTKMDAKWNFIINVSNQEAFDKLTVLCNSFAAPDEARMASSRAKLRKAHEEAIAKIVAKREAEQKRMEEERQRKEAQRIENEKRAKALAEQRKKDAENQQRHEAELRNSVLEMKKSHAETVIKAIFDNNDDDLKRSANVIETFCRSAIVTSPVERKMIADLRAFIKESNAAIKEFRRFETMVGRIRAGHSLIVYPSRNLRATIISIRKGEIKCRDNSDENIVFNLDFAQCENPVKERLSNTMERRFKLKFAGFHLSLLMRNIDSFATRKLPPYWQKNWAVFKELF